MDWRSVLAAEERSQHECSLWAGSGTIGIPLARALVAARHQVTAFTRSESKRDELQALGACVTVADALDRDRLIAAVEAAHPNAQAKAERGWRPECPTMQDGLAQMFRRAS